MVLHHQRPLVLELVEVLRLFVQLYLLPQYAIVVHGHPGDLSQMWVFNQLETLVIHIVLNGAVVSVDSDGVLVWAKDLSERIHWLVLGLVHSVDFISCG